MTIEIIKSDGIIHRTNEYGMFRLLDGNRDVSGANVKSIKKSILEYGYIEVPITVNEHLEIVDGQHRFEALKDLGLPIPYLVFKGIGLKECSTMNTNCKNWTTKDYINANIAVGSKNAEFIVNMKNKYECNYELVMACLYGTGRDGNVIKYAVQDTDITEQMKKDCMYLLELIKLMPLDNTLGSKRTFARALKFLKTCTDCDMKKLQTKYNKHITLMKPFNNVKHCLDSFEKIYNFKSRSEYVYFTQLFENQQRAYKREERKKYCEKVNR